MSDAFSTAFLRSLTLKREKVESLDRYPYSIPAIRNLETVDLHPSVTFFVGENGSGKSTLLEAIAVAADLNPEGGNRNLQFATRSTESSLHESLRLVRGIKRPRDAFFLRAESFYNFATELERVSPMANRYHEMSHGESFLKVAQETFRGRGLYLLDEPEAALSPSRQLTFLRIMHELVREDSQFLIATHSPLILAFPEARHYLFDERGIHGIEYEETEHFRVTRDFLNQPRNFLRHLFADD